MATLEEVLAHYGISGMKWGVRRAPRRASSGATDIVLKTRPGKKIKATGGKGHSPSEDAVKAAITRQKAKKSSVSSLSNKELQELVLRLNLERQYGQLTTKSLGKSFTKKMLTDIGSRKISQVVSDKVGVTGKRKPREEA